MKWIKQGRIFAADGSKWWARSYALIPTVDLISDAVLRIYFAALDEDKIGRIGYIDVAAENPKRILYESEKPVLDIGDLGTFDDSGVNPSCIITVAGKKYLYYIGWQRCERTPHMLFTGLATSNDGCCFQKYADIPVLDREPNDKFLRSAPTVLYDGTSFITWYVSGLKWTTINNKPYPKYVIRFARSSNGIHWTSNNHICINFQNEQEFGFGRPWVIKDGHQYKMWYSIRTIPSPSDPVPDYQIGYAESENGIDWLRKDDEAGIAASDSGWDSEMVCYPCVVDAAGKRYLFYNGNRHGSTGFGYAVLDA
jgi:hypothetical protein